MQCPASLFFVVIAFQHNPVCLNIHHQPVKRSHHGHARIFCHHAFDAGSHQRSLTDHERNCLTLHVAAHERAVGIIVFQKRNQRRGHTHKLVGRNVHQFDTLALYHHHFSENTRRDHLIDKLAVLAERRVCLSNGMFFFFECAQKTHLLRDSGIFHHAVRSLDKSEIIDARIS